MELKEVELKVIDDVMFKRIGVDVPMLPDAEGFSSEQLPVRALAVSNRFGYCLFAHSRGFSVAKTADLILVAEKLKDKSNAGQTAQEKSVVNVTVANIRFLSLSNDELTVAVCSGGSVMFYDLPSLVLKSDTCPFEVRKVDPLEDTHAKDFSWSPAGGDTYLILTSNQQLLLGRVGFPPEIKVKKGVVAASWSEDGQHVAYVSENRQLSITTSTFAKTFDIKLPAYLSDEDVDSDLTVDAIRWVRSDSIIVGYVRVNSEGEEDGYPLFVVTSTNGTLAEEHNKSLGLVFYQLFPSIESFVVPSGSGPYMLVDYLKPWELVVAASRKSIDDHIVLVGWLPENGRDEAFSLELGNDLWLPRIELQESGDDNAIVGLAIDRTTVQIQLIDPKDDAGEEKLPPSPVLICVTLEGKLSFFSFARLDGKWNVPNLVAAPSDMPESKRSSIQGSQASGKISSATSVTSSKGADDQARQRAPKAAYVAEIKEDEKFSPPASSSSPDKGDVKDGTVSLFERFTRPSPSPLPIPVQKVEGPKLGLVPGSAQSGQFQKAEIPKLALISSSHDSRQPSTNPVSALKDHKGAENVGNAYEGLFRPFEDGSKSGSGTINSSFPSAFSFSESARSNVFNNTGSFQNEAITVPSSALASYSQPTGIFQKRTDKVSATRPVSPQPQRQSQFPATSPSIPSNSGLPGKGVQAGANAFNTGAAVFPGKGFDSGSMTNPPGPFSQAGKSSQITNNQTQRPTPIMRTSLPSSAGQDKQSQGRASGLSDMEAAFISELEKVRRMAEEVDQLMSYIEGRATKDNFENDYTFTRQSLEELEQAIHLLSEESKAHRRQLTQLKQSVEDLRDESLRVDSWRIYAKSLMEQKNDSRHLELWTLQKLHPELDIKRKRVLKADQDLKLKIAEMEKHVHNLELKQWQTDSARRRPNKQVRTPGQFLSVQNLYNTVNAQMAVAEELSLSLAQQMETLNINWSSPAKGPKKSTAASILESVGAHPNDVRNSYVTSDGPSPISRQRLTYSPVPKGASTGDRMTMPELCVNTQETTRRRRDSMDATWVESGAPKTTIKRPVHTNLNQGFASGNSSLPTFRQGKGNVPELSSREPWSQPFRPVRQIQNTRMATQTTNANLPAPSFENGISGPVSGRMGTSTYGPQRPLSQPDQQRRSSSTSPNGEVPLTQSNQFALSSSSSNADSKESLFKWANNQVSGPKVNPVAPSYTVNKQGTGGGFDVPGLGPTGKVTASKLFSSGSTDGTAGNVGGNFASAPATKPRLLGAFDGAGSDLTGKSGVFPRLGTIASNKYGSVSSTGNLVDGSRLDKDTNQNMVRNPTGGSTPSLTGPGSTPLLTGSKPQPLLTGPSPPLLLTGATSTGGAADRKSQSLQASERRVESEQDSEGRSDRDSHFLTTSKQRHVTSFPVQIQSSTSGTSHNTQALQPKEPEKQSDEMKTASNTPSISGPTSGSSGKSSLDFSSKSGALGSGGSQSALTVPSSPGFNFAIPSSSAPFSQSQVSKSLFSAGNNHPVVPTSPANKSGPAAHPPSRFEVQGNTSTTSSSFPVPSVNTGLISGGAGSSPGVQASNTSSGPTSSAKSPFTVAASAPTPTPVQLAGSPFTSSSLPTTSHSASSPFTISSASSPSQTTASPFSSSITSAPSQTTGSPFSSSSAGAPSQTTVSPFSASSAAAPSQTTGSPFPASSAAAPSQTTVSPFSASSAAAPSQTTGSPFPASSAAAPSQTTPSPFPSSSASEQSQSASPFASSSISGFSTSGTQMTSASFGQSSMWPTSGQQPFMFPNSSSMAPATSISPTALENNEDDMEEEASTEGITSLGGGFGGFGGLGLGGASTPSQTQKTNPFGGTFFGSSPSQTSTAPSGGQLFRPAAFSLPVAQPQSSPQQTGGSPFGSGFGSSGFSQGNLFSSGDAGKSFGSQSQSSPGGFGQPAQLGPGQQALGSALGAFGQTRQVGFGTPSVGGASISGFSAAPQGGGFANAATGGGFGGAATGGGFASVAAGGGFAGLGSGGGFGASSGGGFQSFGNQGAQPGFGTGMQPAQDSLFTKMRR
ncbi:nuclear pore complex protein Nup214 [Marchantia polymorpha subsp. ruderalis]